MPDEGSDGDGDKSLHCGKYSMKHTSLIRIVIVICILVGILVFSFTVDFAAILIAALTYLRQLSWAGAAAFVGISIVTSILAIPQSFMATLAGFAFHIALGFACVSIGCTIGATIAFFLGKTLLRGWVSSLTEKNLKYKVLDSLVQKKGGRVVVLCRISPLLPFGGVNYVLGGSSIRPHIYVFASWLGMAPGMLMYAMIGSTIRAVVELTSVGGIDENPLQLAFFIVGTVLTVAGVVWITIAGRRAFKKAVEDEEGELEPVSAQADGDELRTLRNRTLIRP